MTQHMPERPIVAVRALRKVYQSSEVEVSALDDIDLTVRRGEFVAVMGPSGCGKSTLLHMIGGLDRPTSGEIEVDGERLDGLSETKLAKFRRRSVGYILQQFNLLGNLTARANVELPALLNGVSAREATRRSTTLLEALGLAERGEHLPSRLSGGEQQRVAIARALINEPAVLLADEPTGALDSHATREVMDLIQQQHRHGQTVILVTHDARVAAMADRVVRMRDGRMVSESVMASGDDAQRRLADLITVEA